MLGPHSIRRSRLCAGASRIKLMGDAALDEQTPDRLGDLFGQAALAAALTLATTSSMRALSRTASRFGLMRAAVSM